MSLIIDASLTISWFFDDENTPEGDAVLERVERSGAVVPALWRFEVVNAFQSAIRRRRTDAKRRNLALVRLGEMPIRVDADSLSCVWTATLQFADRAAITVYDAAYLELAHRMKLPLATLDKQLRRAAEAEGVKLIEG